MSRRGFINVRGGKGSENTKEGEGSTWKEVALVCWEEGCLFPEMKWITPSPTTISVLNKMKWQSPQNFSRSSLNGNRWKLCGLQLECPSKMLRRRRKSPQSSTLSRGEVGLLQSWPWRKAWNKQSRTELRSGDLYDQAMHHKLKCVRYQNLITCLLKLYSKAF